MKFESFFNGELSLKFMATKQKMNTSESSPDQDKCGVEIGKSGKRICCSCPETRKVRDSCVVLEGEEKCKEAIENHNKCLRAEGFKI